MKNKVIIVGDSYAYGHGLQDRVHYYDQKSKTWIGDQRVIQLAPSDHCWASLARRDFTNFEFLNISQPGNSNDNMFLQLIDEINSDAALVIFAGSVADRTIIQHPLADDHIVPWIINLQQSFEVQPNAYINAKENFIKYLYNSKIGAARSTTAILAAWTVALTHQSKFAWCVPREEHQLLNSKELSISHIKGMSFSSIVNYQFVEKFGPREDDYLVADGHINEIGHGLYYENEIKPLLTRLLT